MATGEHKFTKAGNLKKPANDLICHWIMEAWNDIPVEMAVKSFEKCGISNALDGSEDDLIIGEGDGEEDINENKENEDFQ